MTWKPRKRIPTIIPTQQNVLAAPPPPACFPAPPINTAALWWSPFRRVPWHAPGSVGREGANRCLHVGRCQESQDPRLFLASRLGGGRKTPMGVRRDALRPSVLRPSTRAFHSRLAARPGHERIPRRRSHGAFTGMGRRTPHPCQLRPGIRFGVRGRVPQKLGGVIPNPPPLHATKRGGYPPLRRWSSFRRVWTVRCAYTAPCAWPQYSFAASPTTAQNMA